MPNIADVFNGDAFGKISLTQNINNVPYKPRFLQELGIFDGDGEGGGAGVDTQQLAVVNVNEELQLIPQAALATYPNYQTTDPQNIRYITIPHLPLNDTILAHEISGTTRFGETTTGSAAEMVMSVQDAITKKQQKMVDNHNLTWEWMRVNACKGILLDADGSKVIYNWFTTFGITPKTETWTVATPGDFNRICDAINKQTRDALGNDALSGIQALCGTDAMTAMQNSPDLNDGMIRLNDGEFYRTNYVYGTFTYRGITFSEYRGSVGGAPYVADDKIFTFPTGTNTFVRRNGPGDMAEAQGKAGMPMYSAREAKRFDAGWDLHSQSNPVFMCQRPANLMEITLA